MLDTHLVKALFAVPDTSLSLIRLGQKQPVKLDAIPHAFTGVITSIGPQADPQTRVFNGRSDGRELARGDSARNARIRNSKRFPRYEAPPGRAAQCGGTRARQSSRGFAVFRLNQRGGNWYASAQTIEIGETFGDSIEVTRGLSAGQKIISLGGAQLHDGQQVSVIP